MLVFGKSVICFWVSDFFLSLFWSSFCFFICEMDVVITWVLEVVVRLDDMCRCSGRGDSLFSCLLWGYFVGFSVGGEEES